MRRQREQRPEVHTPHHTGYTAADFQSALHGPAPWMEELAYLQALLGPVEALLPQSQAMEYV